MTTEYNNKLKCIITGRQLIATKNYYLRKVEKAGSEEKLHETYMCREAKTLLKQGVSIDRIRELLEATIDTPIEQSVLEQILDAENTTRLRRINNIVNTSKSISVKTDTKVREFINKYIKK